MANQGTYARRINVEQIAKSETQCHEAWIALLLKATAKCNLHCSREYRIITDLTKLHPMTGRRKSQPTRESRRSRGQAMWDHFAIEHHLTGSTGVFSSYVLGDQLSRNTASIPILVILCGLPFFSQLGKCRRRNKIVDLAFRNHHAQIMHQCCRNQEVDVDAGDRAGGFCDFELFCSKQLSDVASDTQRMSDGMIGKMVEVAARFSEHACHIVKSQVDPGDEMPSHSAVLSSSSQCAIQSQVSQLVHVESILRTPPREYQRRSRDGSVLA